MQDYLSERSPFPRPDFVASNRELLSTASAEVILIIIFNVIPGKKGFVSYWQLVRDAIIRLFQIVKLFGSDYMGFLEYLKTIGLISIDDEIQLKQQLRKSSDYSSRFQVHGRYNPDALEHEFPEVMFMNFQSLLLVSIESNESKDTVKDIELS